MYHDPCSWLVASTEETVSSSKNANSALDQNPPTSDDCDTPITNNHGGINSSTQ